MLKKTIMLLVVLLLLVSGVVFSGELSFEAALRLLEEESIVLKIAELNLEIATLDYNRAVASNLMTDSEYNRLQAEHNLAKAKNTYKQAQENNLLEVLRKYGGVLTAERNLKMRELELIVATHNYRIMQEKVRMGDASKLDDLRELNRLEAAQRAVETAELSLAESERALKSLLHITDQDTPRLNSDFKQLDFTLSLAESLEFALENSFDVWDRQFSLELQEMQLRKTKIEGTAPIDLKRAELNMEVARLNQANNHAEWVERVIAAYHGLTQSKAAIVSSERELAIAKDSYSISQQQAEAGLITEIQLIEAELNLLRAEGSLADAIISNISTVIQFQQLIGMEVKYP